FPRLAAPQERLAPCLLKRTMRPRKLVSTGTSGEAGRSPMAKLSKKQSVLFCGTSERIAKFAPVVGVNPGNKPVYLTDVYAGLLAFFASTNDNDRLGI